MTYAFGFIVGVLIEVTIWVLIALFFYKKIIKLIIEKIFPMVEAQDKTIYRLCAKISEMEQDLKNRRF